MKKINILMLSFAILAAISFMTIGVAVASRSILGIILAILFSVSVMGFGFTTKKKLREQGKL